MFSFLFVCVFGFVSRSRFVCLLPSREIYFSYLLFVSFTFNTISMQRVIKCQCCFVSKMHKQYSRHNLSRHWGEYARVSPFAMPIYCPPLWLRILLLRLFLYMFFLFFCSYFYVCFRVCCCCTKWMCSVVLQNKYFYISLYRMSHESPLCVCCVWLSNPLLTKYSLNSWTCTINPYQAVRTQILCFVFRSLSFKKKTRNLFSSPSSCSCPLLYSLDSKVASAVRSQFYCSRQSHIQIDIYLCDLMLHCKAAATVAEDTCHLRTSINVVALVVILRMDSFHFTWK